MKKKLFLFIVILLISAVMFAGCKDGSDGDKTITIYFVTGVENLNIDPVVLDGVNEFFMPEDPLRAGYDFVTWCYDSGLNFPLQREADGRFSFTEDTTLYAKWLKKQSGSVGDGTEVVESGGFTYKKNDSGYYIITGYKGDKSDLVLPTDYNGTPVTGVGDNAFINNLQLVTVTIQSNIQSIGVGAFENCRSLSAFKLTAAGSDYFGVDSLGVLYNRDKTSIFQIGMAAPFSTYTVAKEIEVIRKGAFGGCTFVVEFAPASRYTAISADDFYGFQGTLVLGGNIIKIEQYGLREFYGALVFGSGSTLSEITMGAFTGYRGAAVTLPSFVTAIRPHAFNGCYGSVNLTALTITEISENAFANFYGATLKLPSSVTKIGAYAFYNAACEVSFPSGSALTKIDYRAFGYFGGQAYLPSSVTELVHGSFEALKGGARVYFANSKQDLTFVPLSGPEPGDADPFYLSNEAEVAVYGYGA